MSNKIFLGAVIIVIIAAGYIIYTNRAVEEVTPVFGDGVSFICEDGSNFIANFSADMNSVSVVEAGEVRLTLQNTSDNAIPYRFADNSHTYTFIGEEVVVKEESSGRTFVCRQPFDPNNAPHNFGDVSEDKEEVETDATLAVSQNILGTWRSLDDQRFNREFRADGTFTDSYEGDRDTRGVWRVYTGDTLPKESLTFEPANDETYLMLTDDITPELVMHFRLDKLTSEELEMTYMEGNGILRFVFVNPIVE